MEVVLDKAPDYYAIMLAQMQISQDINLMMVNLKSAMKAQWDFLSKKSVNKDYEVLSSAFNGTC